MNGSGRSLPLSEYSHMLGDRSLCPLLIHRAVLKMKEYLHNPKVLKQDISGFLALMWCCLLCLVAYVVLGAGE